VTDRTLGERVLILRPGALGDTILALPAIRAMRRHVGRSARIEVVGYPRYLRVAVNPLHADASHPVDREVFSGFYSNARRAELLAFLQVYSSVIAWMNDERGEVHSVLSGLASVWLQSAPYPPSGSGVHASDHLTRSLEPLGVDVSPALPELVIPADAETEASDFLHRSGLEPGRFLAIHPGSGSPRKNWPAGELAKIARMGERQGLRLLLIEGEADKESVGALGALLSVKPPLARELDLLVLAAVLSKAFAFVGCDSGVSHLAAAAGAPTVAWFGPTEPETWAPRGRQAKVVKGTSSLARVEGFLADLNR